jgi:Fe2+ transport system protein FeoA
MKLSQLEFNKKAKILAINCDKNTKDRLYDMGVNEEENVLLIRRAPFNDPLEIKVKDFYLALRVCDADKIYVEYL